VYVPGGGSREVNIPVEPTRLGHIAIPITAQSFVGGHTHTHHVFVDVSIVTRIQL